MIWISANNQIEILNVYWFLFVIWWVKLKNIKLLIRSFSHNYYNFFQIIIINHNLLLTSKYICCIFILSGTKFCIFILQGRICSGKTKNQKILYDKYVHMLTIRDDTIISMINSFFCVTYTILSMITDIS